jgi:hypothetical protein
MSRNPFEYGRELGPGELADREIEVAEVRDALLGAQKHFLLGPRRFGKTSVHNVGAIEAREAGAVVLRYNVEGYPSVDALLAAIVADAARLIPGPLERAGAALEKFFKALRPQVTYNISEQSWSASLGVGSEESAVPRLVDTLNGLEAAAAAAGRPVGLVLDEVQTLLREGISAEGQVRAAVQEHRAVGYVFAGSDTRLLTAMVNDAGRPFYRLGSVRFLDEVPRAAFTSFLRAGLATSGATAEDAALEAILTAAQDVPYNVQLLAHHCWAYLAEDPVGRVLTPTHVAAIHAEAARRLDPVYSQQWLSLTAPQQRALQALVLDGADGLYSKAAQARYGLTAAGMQRALDGLVEKQVCWRHARAGTSRVRLEDPLFGVWVANSIAAPRP